MKNLLLFLLIHGSFHAAAQESGNVNYGKNQYRPQVQHMTGTTTSNADELRIAIRGIYNEKPSLFSATFSIVQVGTSLEEIDALMNEKITAIKAGIKSVDPAIEVLTDMISFVPVYEYEVSKKIFSKKTYTEKPAGYEMKKNLIIKYKTQALDKIVSVCAANEVYDLVKVDYVIASLEAVQAKLQSRALEEYNAKLKYYSLVLGEDLALKKKTLSESYNLTYPVESYSRYTAFSRPQLPHTRNEIVNDMAKNETNYYNPIMVKVHDFVVNPEITEPAVQVFYDLYVNIKLKKEEDTKPAEKKVIYMVTANGDLKPLAL
ncbi:SIMPL domain-containing protein [uncultured Flavobacterium sp.]|uniref:SIMPL domain-containing protein n=1 Tax=uncultured Flavobacterium sp. TaxID=165435 RepID=UPI0025F77A38|nr:SIMPL domain-containing protein [uncultured Flavobacterium sp.]